MKMSPLAFLGATTWRSSAVFYALLLVAAQLFLVGCEDDPDASLTNQTPETPHASVANYGASGFGIMPGSVSLGSGSNRDVQFEPINGTPPYTWRVSRSDLGAISSAGLYMANTPDGQNTITVTDSAGRSVQATVIQANNAAAIAALAIVPATSTIGIDKQYQISFQATGGIPPYSWSASSTGLGTITSAGLYTSRTIAGQNTITVRDANGTLASATVIQE